VVYSGRAVVRCGYVARAATQNIKTVKVKASAN